MFLKGSFLATFLTTSLLAALAHAATQCPQSYFCVTVTPSGDHATITVTSTQAGWAGIALGTTRMHDPSSNFPQHNVDGSFVLQTGGTGNVVSIANPSTTPTVVATAGSNVTTYCYDQQSSFCVATVKDSTTVTFTVYSVAKGWVGIGTGSFMDGSTMFVAWKNGANIVISQRSGRGQAQPSYNSNPVFTKVATPSSVTVPSSANLAFSFQIPISSGLVSVTGPSNFIFGTSDQSVSTPSDPSSNFPQHGLYSKFSLDLSKGGVGSTTGGSGVDLVLLHGIFMFIAWGVIPPVAIFIARYFKNVLGHRWYLSHTGLLIYGTGGLIVAGLVVIEINVAPGVTRFVGSSTHGIMGTVVALALYPLQCLLGYASNYFFDPNRRKVAIIDQIHWWVGRAVVVLAIVTMQLGLMQYGVDAPWIAGYWLFVILVPAGLMFYGERRYGGAVHHVDSMTELTLRL
ncbi:hypothetical protein HDU79_011333 [Rhizoclosmatium sp. JEL0117]|nr:hypothetical protein HDU79_011333 [Rhizoclosmatium sp. JEL0117]